MLVSLFLQPLRVRSTPGLRQFSQAGKPAEIGFIGLGNMGGHMARNLMKKGHHVAVYDVNPRVVEAFVKEGASGVEGPSQIARSSPRVIITMLPSSPHVREVYGGLLKETKPGTLLIDCSTVDPATSKDVAKMAEDKQCHAVDAPVSGGVGGAEAGTLTFMVGGPAEAFQKAKPVLEKMGKNIVHCGDHGNGQVAKICNNLLLAIGMIGTAEAMNLGTKLGMDGKLLASILNTSTGRCWSSDTYNPYPGVFPNVPSSRDYEGGFGTALMNKDLSLAQLAAKEGQAKTPLGDLAYQLYTEMTNQGLGKKDFSVIYKYLADKTR